MTHDEWRERILHRYDLEELFNVLSITTENVLDMFFERVYNNLDALEVKDPEGFSDEEAEPDCQGPPYF